jgi:Flp pilus assembly protein protease CpaA
VKKFDGLPTWCDRVVASALMLTAAFTDLREYKIRNALVFALAGFFVLYAIVAAQWPI